MLTQQAQGAKLSCQTLIADLVTNNMLLTRDNVSEKVRMSGT